MRVQGARTLVTTLLQLPALFFYEPIKLVQQLAISGANCINNAGKHRLYCIRAVTQQSINDVFSDSLLKLIGRDRGQVNKRPAFLPPRKQFFLEQPIESGHQRGVGDSLIERQINIAHTDFIASPDLVEDLTLQFPQGLSSNVMRALESA